MWRVAPLVILVAFSCAQDECEVDDDCGPDLRCEGRGCGENGLGCTEVGCEDPKRCVSLGAAGDACEEDRDCGPGTRCAEPVWDGRRQLRVDRSCLPPGGADELCARAEECADGLLCDATLCVSPGARGEGEPCQQETACGPNLACSSVFGGVCVRALSAGDFCGNLPDGCADGLICREGLCAP